MPRYDAARIEPKWQAYWESHATFRTPAAPAVGSGAGKLYVLDMFPYPSGSGLHVGHPEGYTATDIVCRQARMAGKHVLHPMGWDAFGLPAEQHAIQTGVHPAETTRKNIDTFRRQLKMLGFSYDWSREFSTTDPDYFRWTQWIFLELFDTWYDAEHRWTAADGVTRLGKGRRIAELPIPDDVQAQGTAAVRRYQDQHRLAYQHEAPVNWCAALGTVLANEEVIDGTSERGGHPVTRLPLRQWMLRITAYADRLADELEPLDWPDSVKALQRNWIGRSTGAEIDFRVQPDHARVQTDDLRVEGEGLSVDLGRSGPSDDSPATPFPATPDTDTLRVYTTRPDTLFGATYMVLAPEHALVATLTTAAQRPAVQAYQARAAGKSDLERTDLAKGKTGVFTGSHAINPINGERLPIWIADYVLSGYGTGAIMAVPGHDERDLEFAQTFSLPVREVVTPTAEGVPSIGFTGAGTAINSGPYNGLPTADVKQKIVEDLKRRGAARPAVNFKLRDWLFSRQHFWGEPFPLWRELDADGQPNGLLRTATPADLPVRLPENFAFKPHGRPDPPLEEAPPQWLYTTAADGTRLKRETNTMPQWAGSCWYYLRFADPHNDNQFIDSSVEDYWLPVDLYIGGAEHAVLHLLYSRFWHKVLFDRGHLRTPEPFQKLVNQGMILGEPELTGYRLETDGESAATMASELTPDGWVSAKDVLKTVDLATGNRSFTDRTAGLAVTPVSVQPEHVEKKEGEWVLKSAPGIVVESRAEKMSKSRGNVVNPDDIVRDYGADALRLYEMFMGPLEATKPWQMAGVEGVSRFLARVWRTMADEQADAVRLNPAVQEAEPTEAQERLLHRTIKAVTDDIARLSFNTAISRMMEFTNAFSGDSVRPRRICEPFVLILAPFAPHLAEELWELLGHGDSLAYAPWPAFDEAKISEATIEIPVQVNGKLRAKVRVAADADAAVLEATARGDAAISGHLQGKQVVKVIAVPGRMVNFVVKG